MKTPHEIEGDLRSKLDAAKVRADELDKRRAAISYRAHTADTKAAAELTAMNRNRAALALDIDGLAMAHAEAVRHAQASDREEADAAARQATLEKAQRVRELATGATARGAKIAEAARTLRDEILRLNDGLDQLRRLGVAITGERLVALAMTRAIFPLLREAGLDIDTIPPGLRHDAQKLVESYVANPLAWATETLDGKAQTEAA